MTDQGLILLPTILLLCQMLHKFTREPERDLLVMYINNTCKSWQHFTDVVLYIVVQILNIVESELKCDFTAT